MSSSKKHSTTRQIPKWLEQGSQLATQRATSIADRPYTPFTEQRIASLDPNEQRAVSLAGQGSGEYRQDLDRSRALTERGSQSFLDADIQGYMNPYIEGALEPAAREIREQTSRDLLDVGGQAGSVGAFGGARQAIAESETRRQGTEALSDFYGRGYAQAFESGANRFDMDRQAAARGAEQFRALGAQGQQQLTQDIQNLLTTGGLRRDLEQAGIDFDYQQFVEARDWDVTNLQPLLATLSSVPYSETTTQKTKSSGLGNAIGVAATAAGAILNPGSALGGMMGGIGGGSTPSGVSAPSQGAPGYQPSFGEGVLQDAGGGVDIGTPGINATFFGSSYQPTMAA